MIAVIALVLSVASLVATGYGVFVIQRRNMQTAREQLKTAQAQLEAARAHYRLSFKPFLVTSKFQKYISEGKDKGLTNITIQLHNSGIGPALIVSCKVYVDGVEVDSRDEKLWFNVLKTLSVATHGEWAHHNLSKDYCLNAKDNLLLLSANVVTSDPNLALVKAAFERSKIVIVYESFYQERFEYDSTRHEGELPSVRQIK